MPSVPRLVLLLASMVLATGCDTAPRDAREWRAEDHEQPPEARQGAEAPAEQTDPREARQAPHGGAAPAQQDTELVELAWQKNCVQCHGPQGRGDGPQSPMVRAPDLTRGEWQDRVTDAEMLETIRKGRNKMPAFDLPRPVLEGLVRGIRSIRGRR